MMSTDKGPKKKRTRAVLSQDDKIEAEKSTSKLRDLNPDVFELPPSKRTPEELAEYFERTENESTRILPQERRRYVMYLRKSTDDESKQVRSLADQKSECLLLAKTLGVVVAEKDIFEESASAKKSGQRPIFDNLMQGF